MHPWLSKIRRRIFRSDFANVKADLDIRWAHMTEGTCTFHDVVHFILQNNPNGSNPDGSFTVDDPNSFFSPYKILPIAQENKYLGIFFLILSWNCMLCVLIRIASSRRF